MLSFRTEIENPLVEKDIIELEQKIKDFHDGKIDDERFRTLRLARGVYGQRQQGVQMIRIKIPFGKLNARQLNRIADVSDEYSRGRLHITTRQDIQIHHVSLDRTPELWAELEKDEITLREACGNTVRNITASAFSGIDPDEVFDVRPYANAVFEYFLRNPICQEMGRKFKMAFSNNDKDTALGFMHDLGFIAKEKNGTRGFKVLLAGGLGSQSRQADVLYEFIPVNEIIPVTEAVLRLFDRLGERKNRMKARLKFLLQKEGVESFKKQVEHERKALKNETIEIEDVVYEVAQPKELDTHPLKNDVVLAFERWKASTVFAQKQNGLFAIGIKVKLGDFYTDQARVLANAIKDYAGDELTLTIDQNLIIRHVPEANLYKIYTVLKELGLDDLGFQNSIDVTACPGTDTCNLGIASSTGLAKEIEAFLRVEYPNYIDNKLLNIKISGCMNACGQHMIANIGFQGMSIKAPDKRVLPASQILLGGGNLGNGQARFADKVIKIPSKRSIEALRLILEDFEQTDFEEFLPYYLEKGEKYFYDLLKHLGDLEVLSDEDFIDWYEESSYKKEIGVGECAGVVIDLVSTLFLESEDKISLSRASFKNGVYGDAIYHSYAALVNTAKALLVSEGKRTNSYASIIQEFEETFVDTQLLQLPWDFKTEVLKMRDQKPSKELAEDYIVKAEEFYQQSVALRTKNLENENS